MNIKEYHFTDEQIDRILRLVRSKEFVIKWNPSIEDVNDYYDYNELGNLIEDQIVNHPQNEL